ncbi:unnamed protein product [Camellia sinensis]
MDVDSSMASETDHDPTGPNNNGPTSEQVEQAPAAVTSGPPPPAQAHQSPVAGPRTAPTYSVVNAILEKKEDGPGPRCGHTLTAVAAVGEEGTTGYIGRRLILFGGATALEGNSAAPGTPSSAGSAGIRGLHPLENLPTPRAAHVATAVGTMVVIQGGIGLAGLSAEDPPCS